MAQNIFFYNNTSLAEAITDASAIVGKSTTSNIVEFQSKYANVYDIPYNYDNIVQFTGNNNKVAWETVNGKQVLTSNTVTEATENVTAEVNGVVCLLGIADVCRQVCLAFGLKEVVEYGDRNAWGHLYPVFQELCAIHNVNEARLEQARIAITVTADGKMYVPNNFIDDVASALARAQLTQSMYSDIYNVGDVIPKSAIGLNNQYAPVWNRFAHQYSSTTDATKQWFDPVVNPSCMQQAYSNLLRLLAQEHLDYDAIIYQVQMSRPSFGMAWAQFGCTATAVTYPDTFTIAEKQVISENSIAYRFTGEVTPIKSYTYGLRYDWVYEKIQIISEVSTTHAGFQNWLGVQEGGIDGYDDAFCSGNSTTIRIGDPPEFFEYIGDPLSLAPWQEQYPAWMYNAIHGNLPVTRNDPNADPQAGVIGDAEPYPWAETLPVPEIPPINPADPPITPDTPEPKPDFPPLPIVIPSYDANKLFSVHTIDASNMNTLGGYLWSSSFASLIEHMFSEPIHAVLGLHELHYGGTISVGSSEEIKLGAFGSGAHGNLVTNRYLEFSCGSITVKEHYGNVEDYDPYTKLQLYLPYVGFVPIATNEVMGKKVTVKYGIDVYTGGCVARVIVTNNGVEQELYNFQGQCGCQLPVTSADYSSLVSRPLIGAALGAVTGGAVGAITGGIGGLASARIDYNRTNGFNSNTGVMLRQKPMLLIERPIAFNAQSYPAFYGNPTNWTVTLSECSGYTRVKDIHIDKTKATDEEKLEIERLLKEGVII